MVKSKGDVDATLRHLHSVIRVPGSPNEVPRVLRLSFVAYITNKERCHDDQFLVDVPSKNRILAQHCLEIMTESLRRNMVEVEDWTMRNVEVEDFKGKVEKAISSELRYAC